MGSAKAFLTFDIDFLDPAYAPGTGTPVPGGFTTAQTLELVRGLADLNIVGYDVVEVSPPYDPTGITSIAAAGLMQEFLSRAYKKKNGKVIVFQQGKEYTFPIPSAIEDNKFYYAALPHKVNTFIDKALMDKQDIERMENFRDDDNQVVICYELK